MSDQIQWRRKKFKDLCDSERNPYLVDRVVCNSEIRNLLKYDNDLELPNNVFSLIGRIVSIRQSFVTIRENWCDLQIYLSSKSKSYKYLNDYLDVGDYVYVKGTLFRTNLNKLTLRVDEIDLISKCFNVFPDQYYGIKDDELKSRDRVGRALADKDFWDSIRFRSKIIFKIRKYLNDNEYLEIETPILNLTSGGANAIPFSTYCESLKENFFMRIATELSLKKAIVSGFSKVYELGKVFRNEGIDSSHNPEFTSLEVYTVNFGLEETMDFTERLFKHLDSAFNTSIFNSKPFTRVSMNKLVHDLTGVDFYNDDVTFEKALELANNNHLNLDFFENTVGHIFYKLFDKLISKTLIEPTFVFGFPKDVSPLSKLDPNNTKFTLRYELYINGMEFANGFAELNDPDDQRSRFEIQQLEKTKGNKEASEIDEDYIHALSYGLPPTGGFGIGIDRMIMLFSDKKSIRDVIFFPQIKKNDR